MKTVRSLPASVTLDDLLSAGWIGLAEALQRRTPTMDEEQFEAYASHRVQGAILDYLRSLDPLTRKLRGASRRISEATGDLTARLGRAPDEDEIAGELGLPLDSYHQMLMQIAEAGLARLELTEDSGWLGEQASPEALATEHELTDQVAAAIDELPERLRTVLGLYYQEECSFREIGAVLGVTESRACQLHTEAVHRIRGRIKGRSVNNSPRAAQSA
jgi:RNA polymerase sigma factor for flagellar operon FliA